MIDSDRDRNDLKAWFGEWWDDEDYTRDVKDIVLQELDRIYSDYNDLVKKCLESITQTFSKSATASLFAGRDGKLPSTAETPKELETEYELLTWLVIMASP